MSPTSPIDHTSFPQYIITKESPFASAPDEFRPSRAGQPRFPVASAAHSAQGRQLGALLRPPGAKRPVPLTVSHARSSLSGGVFLLRPAPGTAVSAGLPQLQFQLAAPPQQRPSHESRQPPLLEIPLRHRAGFRRPTAKVSGVAPSTAALANKLLSQPP